MGSLLPSKWWVSHLPDRLVFAVMKHIWHKLSQAGFPGKQTLVNFLEMDFLRQPTLVGWFHQLLLEVYWPWIWVVQRQSVCCSSLELPVTERSRMEISAGHPSVAGSPSVSDEHNYFNAPVCDIYSSLLLLVIHCQSTESTLPRAKKQKTRKPASSSPHQITSVYCRNLAKVLVPCPWLEVDSGWSCPFLTLSCVLPDWPVERYCQYYQWTLLQQCMRPMLSI